MRRCIQLAKNGLGTTYPNPLVGSVIVYENKIIGEGWHRQSGMPHAEVNAINSVKNKQLLRNATIYINLEPCSHTGKTPPCANLIIEKQIKNVVIGCKDPNPKVAGNGIQLLKKSGLKVTCGILENECEHLNKRFFSFFLKKRPYIILKWAETLDGFISPNEKKEKKPVWISNKNSRQLVHQWRAEEQAILVGTQTVVDDNPSLNTRDWYGNSPICILIDKSLRISKDHKVYKNNSKTIVITEKQSKNKKNQFFESINFNSSIANQIGAILYSHGIQSVIIEGGAQTLQTFIDENLWDEARVFSGPITFNNGTKAPIVSGTTLTTTKIKQDILNLIIND
tara:strand:+ start:2172 stop:3188 length:1017 start_codon:yes stop_codon:yes gene_type:complete